MLNILPTYAQQTTGRTTTATTRATTTTTTTRPPLLATLTPILQLPPPGTSETSGLVIEQIWPWKGLVALKEKDIVVPENYRVMQWTADLRKCSEAETALGKLFQAFAGTIKTAEPAPDSEVIANIEKFAEDGVDDLNQLNLQSATKDLRMFSNVLPASVEESTCLLNSTLLLGAEACDDFLREVTILEDTATTALGSDKGQAGALSGLTSIKARYTQQLQTLQDVMSHFSTGEMPERFDSWFTATCPATAPSCSLSQAKHSSLWSLAKVNQVFNDSGRLTIQITTPCLNTADVLEQHCITALPFEENGRYKQVKLREDLRLWVRKYDPSNWTLVEQPLRCTVGNGRVDICPPQVIRETSLQSLDDNTLEEEQYSDDQPSVEVIDLSDNQVLVASSKQETAVYKCPHANAQEYPLRGINKLKVAPGCSVDLSLGKIHLQGQVYDDIPGPPYLRRSPHDKEWLPLTRNLVFGKNIVQTPDDSGNNQYQQHVATYVGSAMIAVALIALLCIIFMECRRVYKKKKQRRRGRQVRRNQARMIVRNVPDV
jgi:hypothetical protein